MTWRISSYLFTYLCLSTYSHWTGTSPTTHPVDHTQVSLSVDIWTWLRRILYTTFHKKEPLIFDYSSCIFGRFLWFLYRLKQEWMNTLPCRHKQCHFNLNNYVSTLFVKTKNSTKRLTAYCSAFCRTYRSKLSQKVVQCSFLSLFVRKFFQQSSDRKYYTLSWVLSKIYLQTQYG